LDSLIDYLMQNHDELLYGIAGLSLVVELGIIGLSGPLLFFSIGCVGTGLLVTFGVLQGWEVEVLSVGILSGLSALLLWRPLKQLQGGKIVQDTSSDMIGQVVPVSEPVTENGGKVRHSGINWNARLDDNAQVTSLESGCRVRITAVDGNVLIVDQNHKS
jgi:membrane protein implicated in regulation of membrane protease activity